jgi:tetratricopeptide (TPR) repeat protein
MGTVAIFYQYVKKDLDKAEHFYREAVRQSRGDPQVCCNLALFLYKERKNFEEARQVLEQVMRSRPGFEAAVTAYCDLLTSLGATDREKAVSIAGDFLLSAKLHHSQAALLAASLSSLGQGQRAMALLEDSLTRAPWSAELLDQLAQVTLSTTQDAKQAWAAYERVLALPKPPSDPWIWMRMGTFLRDRGAALAMDAESVMMTCYHKAVELNDAAPAHVRHNGIPFNFANLLATKGRLAESLRQVLPNQSIHGKLRRPLPARPHSRVRTRRSGARVSHFVAMRRTRTRRGRWLAARVPDAHGRS